MPTYCIQRDTIVQTGPNEHMDHLQTLPRQKEEEVSEAGSLSLWKLTLTNCTVRAGYDPDIG